MRGTIDSLCYAHIKRYRYDCEPSRPYRYLFVLKGTICQRCALPQKCYLQQMTAHGTGICQLFLCAVIFRAKILNQSVLLFSGKAEETFAYAEVTVLNINFAGIEILALRELAV